MQYNYIIGVALVLLGTFISAFAQIMLKKSAQRKYQNHLFEYINTLVIGGYFLLFCITLLNVFVLRYIPMSLAAALDSTGQIFVPLFSFFVLKEHINRQKLWGMVIIVIGLIVYFL